ncbi:MAG: glycosyltransferase [Actinomycetota bacterium]
MAVPGRAVTDVIAVPDATGGSELRLGVALLTYNAAPQLDTVLDGIDAQVRTPDSVFVVDNGSTDETVEICRRRGVPVVEQENLGVGAGHTVSIRAGLLDRRLDGLLLIEHDCIPTASCLAGVEEAMLRLRADGIERFALSCERTHSKEDPERIDEAQTGRPEVRITRPYRLTFNGLLVTWPLIERIGYPRTDLFVGQEDSDLMLRIERAGVLRAQVTGAVVIHDGKGRRRRGESIPLLRREYSARNSTYREVTSLGRPGRAARRLLGHAAASLAPGARGAAARRLARASLAGIRGDLGEIGSRS